VVTDAHGNPVSFEITGGKVHDSVLAFKLLEVVPGAEIFVADKGYDSEEIRNSARDQGIRPIIPRKSNSKKTNPEFDSHLYKLRHLVEHFFAKIKHFRSISTRFEKLARNFKSMVYLACS
jgi:transposase